MSINISHGGIPKYPTERVQVFQRGMEGDGHNHVKHYRAIQAVSIQDVEKLEELKKMGYPLYPGATGENITVANLNVNSLALGTILRFAGGVEVQLTKVRQPCYVLDSIDPQLKVDIIGRCGMYAKVLSEGYLNHAESIEVVLPAESPII